MNTKKIVVPTLLALLIFGVVMGLKYMPQASISNAKGDVHYHANVCIYKNNKLVECHHNLLTNGGKEHIEQQLSGTPSATQIVKYISVASNSSTPAATWDVISNELTTSGFSRAAGTYESNAGSGSWNVYYTYTATGTVNGINMTGLYWNDTTNSLFAATTFSDTNVISGDTLKINWTITVS